MIRTISFSKNSEDNKYIFMESENKKIEIDVENKILNGLELYNNFFKEYNIEDTFDLIDKTNDDDKKTDKMCNAIFNKVKELFEEIDKSLKIELSSKEDKDDTKLSDI